MICLGILIFIIGCCLSSYEDNSYREAQRHKELMTKLSEKKEVTSSKASRVTRRRIVKDKDGNVLAEEIIEEVVQ